MANNFPLINEFELVEKMMADHSSETFKYKLKSNNSFYAVKRYPQDAFLSSEREIDFQREKSALFDISKKNSPNIPKLFNTFEDPSYRYLLMEYYEGQNLESYAQATSGKIDEKIIIHILKEMLKTLCFLHDDCHIIHRNIKPSNIVIDKNNNIKLIGFSLAAYLRNKNKLLVSKNSFKGQIKYSAPEILFGTQIDAYDAKVDIFSLGYSIYYLMNKELPTETKVLNSYVNRENKPLKSNNYSPWLVKFVESLFANERSKRPSASEALKILENNIKK